MQVAIESVSRAKLQERSLRNAHLLRSMQQKQNNCKHRSKSGKTREGRRERDEGEGRGRGTRERDEGEGRERDEGEGKDKEDSPLYPLSGKRGRDYGRERGKISFPLPVPPFPFPFSPFPLSLFPSPSPLSLSLVPFPGNITAVRGLAAAVETTVKGLGVVVVVS